MIDIYAFMEACKEEGYTGEEALNEYYKAVEEERNSFYERYYDDPLVNEGFRQQDIIDMYRNEF